MKLNRRYHRECGNSAIKNPAFNFAINFRESSPREDESSSSSEDELAEEEEEDIEEDEDTIDGHISETAARNNLSRNTVKDIIKQLVSNDQVIAICKLRAEEIERHIEEEKRNFTKQLLDDTPDGVKLTRNKAK